MDPRMAPKGEYNFGEQDGTAVPNQPGVYFHEKAGKFVETTGVKRPDGSISYARDAGKIQGDAFTQMGYRPASEEEARYYHEAQKAAAIVKRKRLNSKTTAMSSAPRN